jgi:hypothetical protein
VILTPARPYFEIEINYLIGRQNGVAGGIKGVVESETATANIKDLLCFGSNYRNES